MDLVVQLDVAQRTPRLVAVVVIVHLRQGVDAGVGADRAVGSHPVEVAVAEVVVNATIAVVEIGGYCRAEADSTAYGTRVGIVGLVENTLGVDVHAQVLVKEGRGQADGEVSTLVITHLQRGLVECVAQADAVGEHALDVAIEADVLVGGEGRAVNQVLPVGVGRTHQRLDACQTVGTCIDGVHVVAVLVTRQHIHGSGVLLQAVAGVVADLHFVARAFLRGNDDDAVGGTRTIDGRGRGIFQHRIGLDVVGVDRSQGVGHACTTFCRYGHAVNHDQRVVAGIEGSCTTDTDGGTACGVTRSRSHQQARHFALQHLVG